MLKNVDLRIAAAGGFDKVPAILAALRGGYVNVLITDAATGRGILHADGVTDIDQRPPRLRPDSQTTLPSGARTRVKKFLNDPDKVVEEMLDGAVRAHRNYLSPIDKSHRALVARDGPRPGKVGLVIGGGSGHEPGFLGYVGKGLADAVAIGNIFSSPPPIPILHCAKAASGGAGVLFVYGNYAGDVMNFEMAAELTETAESPFARFLPPTTSPLLRSRTATGGAAWLAVSLLSRSLGPPAISVFRSMPAKP